MNRLEIDIMALTKETLDLSDSFTKDNRAALPPFPKSTGVIYRVQKDGGTFCLRGLASENIREDMDSIAEGHGPFEKTLRVSHVNEFDLGELCFFQTDSLEQAEVIVDEMINRRFPLREESFLDLSSPDMYWSMSFSDTSLVIYFQSQHIGNNEVINLGPIGDNKVAIHCFRTLQIPPDTLGPEQDIVEFYCTENLLKLSCSEESVFFESFKNIFLKGEYPKEGTFPFHIFGRTLLYLLKEIANLRKFWIDVGTRFS